MVQGDSNPTTQRNPTMYDLWCGSGYSWYVTRRGAVKLHHDPPRSTYVEWLLFDWF